MTVKEQIQKKISEYKEDFFKECGFNLIVIPLVGLPKVSIYKIADLCCDFLKVEKDDIDSRKKLSIKAKEFIFGVTYKMSYDNVEIFSAISLDRTSFYNIKDRFTEKCKNRAYKYEFYAFIEYLYNNIDNPISKDNWLSTVEYLDTIFVEDLPTEEVFNC